MTSGEAESGTLTPEYGREREDAENNMAPTSPFSEATFDSEPPSMTRSQALNIYSSHFLSTWNVRTYEFAAVGIQSDIDLLDNADPFRLCLQLLLIQIPSLLLLSGITSHLFVPSNILVGISKSNM